LVSVTIMLVNKIFRVFVSVGIRFLVMTFLAISVLHTLRFFEKNFGCCLEAILWDIFLSVLYSVPKPLRLCGRNSHISDKKCRQKSFILHLSSSTAAERFE
jgi:hypothetical protein